MVIRSEAGMSDVYTTRMISGNKIPGLLGFQEKWLDGTSLFYYDITSKQPLSRLTERRKMKANEIRTLISDLILILRQMERYLLDEQRICLKPDYIYIDPETFHGSFCMIPGYSSEFTRGFLDFAQYILDHVDHSDGDAVVLAFAVFRECRKENFGVEDIERCMEMGMRPTEIMEVPIQKAEEISIEEVQIPDKQQYEYPLVAYERDQGRLKLLVLCMAVVGGMIIIPIICVALFGLRQLLQWKWIILALEIMVATVGMAAYYFLRDGASDRGESGETAEFELEELVWELAEEEEKERVEQVPTLTENEPEDTMQTVLLISQSEIQAKRKLYSLTDGKEIPIGYFPFLIGKNRGLVDFCLNESGVSRLHAKIERDDTGFFITDLNSTNGTKVNGSLLEANEQRQLRIGDELSFAGILFRFQ